MAAAARSLCLFISGTAVETNGAYTLSTSMNSYLLKGTFTGSLRHVGDELEFSSSTRYSIYDGPEHTIAISTRMWQETYETQHVYMANMDTKVKFATWHAMHMNLYLRTADPMSIFPPPGPAAAGESAAWPKPHRIVRDGPVSQITQSRLHSWRSLHAPVPQDHVPLSDIKL